MPELILLNQDIVDQFDVFFDDLRLEDEDVLQKNQILRVVLIGLLQAEILDFLDVGFSLEVVVVAKLQGLGGDDLLDDEPDECILNAACGLVVVLVDLDEELGLADFDQVEVGDEGFEVSVEELLVGEVVVAAEELEQVEALGEDLEEELVLRGFPRNAFE